jgi:glycine hydroxymethyltransferase
MVEAEMARIAGWIARVLDHPGDEELIGAVRGEVTELCGAHALYEEYGAVA